MAAQSQWAAWEPAFITAAERRIGIAKSHASLPHKSIRYINHHAQKNGSAAILCAGALLAAGSVIPALADTTTVTETITDTQVTGTTRDHFSGLGDLAKPLLLTVSYSKGKWSRFDTEQRIILRGLKDSVIEVLTPGDMTYYTTTEAAEYARTNIGGSMMLIAGAEGEVREKPKFTDLPEPRILQGATVSGANAFDLGGIGDPLESAIAYSKGTRSCYETYVWPFPRLSPGQDSTSPQNESKQEMTLY